MVGYMSVEEQVDADFSRARRRAFLRRISARLRKGRTPNHLACFEEVSNKVGAVGGISRGRRTVRLADIVGSVSRCSEFNRSFFPLRESARTKWKRMDRAFHRGEELPPVSLYKIDEYYFVLDGNHRVSVYRYHGVEWIDADVTEFRTPLPKDRKDERCPIYHHPTTGMKGAVRTCENERSTCFDPSGGALGRVVPLYPGSCPSFGAFGAHGIACGRSGYRPRPLRRRRGPARITKRVPSGWQAVFHRTAIPMSCKSYPSSRATSMVRNDG